MLSFGSTPSTAPTVIADITLNRSTADVPGSGTCDEASGGELLEGLASGDGGFIEAEAEF